MKTMKKIFLSFILIFSILLVSCTNVNTTIYTTTAITPTTPTHTTISVPTTSIQSPELPLYTLSKTDGYYYIQLTEDFVPYPSKEMTSLTIEFESFSEMRYRIENNLLTIEELSKINLWNSKNSNGIRIANLDKIYMPSLASHTTTSGYGLINSGYGMFFSEETYGGSGSFIFYNEESDFTQRLTNYTDWKDNPLITVTSVTTEEERNATVTYYKTSVAEMKRIDYVITDGTKTLYVQEKYVLKSYNDMLNISETVPQNINILGMDNGEYFEFLTSDCQSRPSFEWIKYVGITEFKN